MASEDEKKTRKKKKKLRKDKWGQPIASPAEEVEGEEEESHGFGGGGGGGGEYDEASAEQQKTSYETNKVVVSGMPYTTTEDEIRDLFKEIGSIIHLQLSRFPDTGNFRGLAFVTFESEKIAACSLRLDGAEMGNRFLKVERCRLDSQKKRKCDFLDEPKKVDGCLSAYIGNLSWDVTENDIRECFETSKIVSIRFAMDKNTGTFRGFGHMDFEDDESLEEAMKKNQVELHGRPMKISYAVCKRN